MLEERLTVIFPTFNSAPVLPQALQAVPPGAPVIISDNASADDIEGAARALRPDACVLRATRNDGFAAACNRGLERCRTPFAAIVNPDLVVAPDCLPLCVEALERNPGFAMVSGREGDAQTPSGQLAVAPSLYGALLVMRISALAPLGFYDESFFLYFEDTDLYLRSRAAGWKLGYVSGAHYAHAGGASSVGQGAQEPERARLWGMGCAHFAARHAGTPEGEKAARKLRAYRRKLWLARLTGNRDAAATLAARLSGARQRRREGPGCMRDTAFRT